MLQHSPIARLGCGTAVVLALLLPSGAAATNYAITTFADVVAADGACSLREALRAAQGNVAVNECAAGGLDDTIVLQSTGTYTFINGDEPLTNGPVTIRGASGSPANHVIDLQSVNRFLRVQSNARLTLEGVTLTHGSSLGANPPSGGALRVVLTELVLRDVVISSCTAGEEGGGLFHSGVSSNVTMERVRFVDNLVLGTINNPVATGGGASVRAPTAALSDVVFDGNRSLSPDPGGRGFAGGAQLTLTSGQSVLRALDVRNNEAEGQLSSQAAGVFVAAVTTGQVTIEDGTFADNSLVTNPSGTFGVALVAIADQQGGFDIRRLRVSGSDADNPAVAQVTVSAQGDSTVTLDGLAIHASPTSGLFLDAFDDGLLVAGQLTVTGNLRVGVKVNGQSSVPIRLENSILWNNGTGGIDDVSITGSADAGQGPNHLWIGELGDPDPLFVNAAAGDLGLQAGSGAVNAGAASFPSVGPYDAAHAQRVIGPAMDLGAFERGGVFADGFESGGLWAWAH